MKLRNWQSECINSAISNYKNVKKHFLTLATPGAGKTLMASVLAKKLYDLDMIDLVLCFSPSSIVAQDFGKALSEQFQAHFDGTIGAMGNSYTYQGLNTLDDSVWRLFDRYRVYVIFDEIHHCAGSNIKDANAWGKSIIETIKENAAYTIALTGTPWRSDSLPIVLADYCNQSKKIQCDFVYGLKEAVRDNVCRIPQVVVLDNDQITIVDGDESSHFASFLDLLSQGVIPYSEVVTNESVIENLFHQANSKLDNIRTTNLNAGGLIVACSISHAWQIQLVLRQTFGQTALVVTSDEDTPNDLITSFRYNQDKWIISVGMISEGTNIPRLQVCCYLSNVKTEMYYRQVLGRILRITNSSNQEAFLFMPAAPELVEYAYRVAQDIPDGLSKVKFTQMTKELITDITNDKAEDVNDHFVKDFVELAPELEVTGSLVQHEISEKTPVKMKGTLGPIKEEYLMDFVGKFKHEQLEIKDFELYQISNNSMNKLNMLNAVVV
ncbi:MAG: DEAD/DEAH box helicase family protein [Colwellia sp.]|nr:DEAD/DEAH box helicase family protein [Colwellia sp.]